MIGNCRFFNRLVTTNYMPSIAVFPAFVKEFLQTKSPPRGAAGFAQSGKRPPPPSDNETGPRHVRPPPPPQCNGEWSTCSARGPPPSPPSAGILRAGLPYRFRRRWTRPTGKQRPGLRPTFCGAFPFPTNKTTAPPSGLARVFCQGAGCEPKTFPLTYRFIPRCSTPPSTNPQIRHHHLTAWALRLSLFFA